MKTTGILRTGWPTRGPESADLSFLNFIFQIHQQSEGPLSPPDTVDERLAGVFLPYFSLPGSRVEIPTSLRKHEKWPIHGPPPTSMVVNEVLSILGNELAWVGFCLALSSKDL